MHEDNAGDKVCLLKTQHLYRQAILTKLLGNANTVLGDIDFDRYAEE